LRRLLLTSIVLRDTVTFERPPRFYRQKWSHQRFILTTSTPNRLETKCEKMRQTRCRADSNVEEKL